MVSCFVFVGAAVSGFGSRAEFPHDLSSCFLVNQEHIMASLRSWPLALGCIAVGGAALIGWRIAVGTAGPVIATGSGITADARGAASKSPAALDPLVAALDAAQARAEIKLDLKKLGVDDSAAQAISNELRDLLLVLRGGSWSDMEAWRSSRGLSPKATAADAAGVWEESWTAQVAVLRTAIPLGPAQVRARVIDGRVIEPDPPAIGHMHLGGTRGKPDKNLPNIDGAVGNWYEVVVPVTVGDASGRSAEILLSVQFARRPTDGRWIPARVELLNVPMELQCLVPVI